MSIDRLAARVAAVSLNARGRRLYPATLKREIMAALAASGLTHDAFAEKVGVPSANLSNWKKPAAGLAANRAPSRPSASFKAIAVEPEGKAGALSLKAPGGVIIEGLSIAAAAELLHALSGRSQC